MAKNAGDVILRDRMQFDLQAGGDRTTLYGRIDLSSYVNPVSREGLAIKEIRLQLRQPTGNNIPNTGALSPIADWQGASGTVGQASCLKVYATTRAYENAAEVGIASPDVLCVLDRFSIVGPTLAGVSVPAILAWEDWYGPKDLHPEGYTVVSDLLIGVAADNWALSADDTMETDVMLIAEPIKITTERMNEILSQAQDL